MSNMAADGEATNHLWERTTGGSGRCEPPSQWQEKQSRLSPASEDKSGQPAVMVDESKWLRGNLMLQLKDQAIGGGSLSPTSHTDSAS